MQWVLQYLVHKSVAMYPAIMWARLSLPTLSITSACIVEVLADVVGVYSCLTNHNLSMRRKDNGVCEFVCHSVCLLPRFLPPHARNQPKSGSNGFIAAPAWSYKRKKGDFHTSTPFLSYDVWASWTTIIALAYLDSILPVRVPWRHQKLQQRASVESRDAYNSI